MAKKRKAAPQPPEGVLSLSVNGHTLTGEKRDGKWTFTCPDFPEIPRIYNGTICLLGVTGAFFMLGALMDVEIT